MDIRLKFINRATNLYSGDIVLFQKNVATDLEELATAWKVIRHCGYECHHPIVYPLSFEVTSSDDFGNYSPRIAADRGQLLAVTPTPRGRRLTLHGSSTSPLEVQVLNGLSRGAVNINIFRGGHVLARKTSVAPEQKVVFRFPPELWIGAVSQIEQGGAIDAATLSSVNTQLSLLGIASADIVMTGGGPDADARAYVFTLQNVVRT